MRECPTCFRCFGDEVSHCPIEGRATFHSLPGEPVLDGRYVLERRLGEGGMGVVYKAHHKFLRTTRAIKIIKPELMGNDPSFATRFQQEAMAAAAIGHPNIISVPDYGFLGGEIPFLVMEFVEGDSLQEVMTNEGKFSPEKALEYVSVIASAIGAAHAHGIVHRDLKPLNIMIRRHGTPREAIRVLDFGLAKIKSGDLFGSFIGAKTTGIIGSPYYMAPEQWSDEEPDKRCDIYSLGIILHQMLTGDVPFKGAAIPVVMNKHLLTPPPRLATTRSGISQELERVVHHALEKNPRARTASAERLVTELEKAVLGNAPSGKTIAKRRTGVKAKATTTRSKGSATARITAEQKKARREEKELARSTGDQEVAWRTTQRDQTQPLEAETLDLKQQSAERGAEERESNRNAEREPIQQTGAAEPLQTEAPPGDSVVEQRGHQEESPTGPADAAIQAEAAAADFVIEQREHREEDPTGAAEPSIQTEATLGDLVLEQRARQEEDSTGAADAAIHAQAATGGVVAEQREHQEEDPTGAGEPAIQTEATAPNFVVEQGEDQEEAGHTEPELKLHKIDAEEEDQRGVYSSEALPTAPLPSPPMNSALTAPLPELSPVRIQIPYDQPLRKPLVPAAVVALIISAVGVAVIISALGVYFLARTRPASEDATSADRIGPREMVFINGGTFTMGSNVGRPEQKPAHVVTVLSFYIEKKEVTNADYSAFVKATGHPAPVNNEADPRTVGYWQPWKGTDPPPGREQWPVCNVSARDAEKFAQWLSKRDGITYRLPTEKEWEYAARNGSKSSLFPWGNSWVEGRENINNTSSPRDVGSFPDGATQTGLLDMIGNVWEWTASKASFYDEREVKPEVVSGHVARGGSFAERINDTFSNGTDRAWFGNERDKFPTVGFRLARDAKN